MMGLAAPIAVWGGAAAASNGTNGGAFSALAPSLPEAAMFGILGGKHNHGMGSAGLVGYSTFFTGYNPQQGHGGFMRAASLGRAASGMLSTIAQQSQKLMTHGSDAWHMANRIGIMHEYGLQGALTYVKDSDYRDTVQTAYRRQKGQWDEIRAVTKNQWRDLGIEVGEAAKAGGPISPTLKDRFNEVDARWQKMSGETWDKSTRRAALGTARTEADATFASRFYKRLRGASMGSGEGFDETGQLLRGGMRSTGRGGHVWVAEAGSKSAQIGGAIGRNAGRLLKVGMALELASFALTKATDFAGDAYASAVNMTRKMQDTYGMNGNVLSPAYMSQAAVTERQRAQLELNSSVLNPRTQMMGNEAQMYHR